VWFHWMLGALVCTCACFNSTHRGEIAGDLGSFFILFYFILFYFILYIYFTRDREVCNDYNYVSEIIK
jgi:hypothetical protein